VSCDPVTSRRPSAEKSTAPTMPRCPAERLVQLARGQVPHLVRRDRPSRTSSQYGSRGLTRRTACRSRSNVRPPPRTAAAAPRSPPPRRARSRRARGTRPTGGRPTRRMPLIACSCPVNRRTTLPSTRSKTVKPWPSSASSASAAASRHQIAPSSKVKMPEMAARRRRVLAQPLAAGEPPRTAGDARLGVAGDDCGRRRPRSGCACRCSGGPRAFAPVLPVAASQM